MSRPYATGTTVSVEQSQLEIQRRFSHSYAGNGKIGYFNNVPERCWNTLRRDRTVRSCPVSESYRTSPIPSHCGKGHELTPENTHITKTGKWQCKTCNRERARRLRTPLRTQNENSKAMRRAGYYADVSAVDLSWLAGVFEGEGTVSIARSRHYTFLLVSVTSTDLDIVNAFQFTWPTPRLKDRVPQSSPNARRAWTWHVSSMYAAVVIEQLLPFVRTHRVREKIELALEMQASKRQGTNKYRDGYREQQEEYRRRMAELNKRGRR